MSALRALCVAWAGLPWAWRTAAALAWAGLIFWLSAQPAGPPPTYALQPFLHNGGHVVAYGGLASLVALAFGAGLRRNGVIAAWSLATLYGASDEYHQSMVPGRVASFGDLASDACGALLGLAVLLWLWRGDAQARCVAILLVPVAIVVVVCETLS